jgi:hypothetical protein
MDRSYLIHDILPFLLGVVLLGLYLVWSARTEMGTVSRRRRPPTDPP